MAETLYMPTEEINKKMAANDMTVINGVIKGEIKPVETKPAEQTNNLSANLQTIPPINENLAEIKQAEEIERTKKYAQMIEENAQKNIEAALVEKQQVQQELEGERKKREEIYRRLQELENSQLQQQLIKPAVSQNTNPTEDELFIPDYIKETQKELEQLKKQIGAENPAYTELRDRLEKIESEKKLEQAEREKIQDIERREKERTLVHKEIEELQTSYDELKTQKGFNKLSEEFLKFRKDLAIMAKCNTSDEADAYVMRFFDPIEGENIRKKAEEIGIVPPTEHEKFLEIINLIDTKNGVQYDPVLHKFIDIKDDFGNKVRYRSLEDVYRIRNFDKELINNTKKTISQVSSKISDIETGKRVIDNSETVTIDDKLTPEQVQELISLNPALYWNDIEKRSLVKRAYEEVGLQPPLFRGQKM